MRFRLINGTENTGNSACCFHFLLQNALIRLKRKVQIHLLCSVLERFNKKKKN
jgi:hypothetical protein